MKLNNFEHYLVILKIELYALLIECRGKENF